MRKRGTSPHLVAARERVRTAMQPGVAHQIKTGDPPIQAWRTDCALTVERVAKAAGMGAWRYMDIEAERVEPTAEELVSIAKALRVTPDLLRRP